MDLRRVDAQPYNRITHSGCLSTQGSVFMKRAFLIAGLAFSFSAFGVNSLLAQGKAPGAGRGLQSAANGAAAAGRGMGRVPDSIPSANPSADKAAAALNGNPSGFQRSGNAVGRVRPSQSLGNGFQPPAMNQPATSQPGMNQSRIADQRIQKAEHLRGLSDRTGNESLMMTADRMEASALANQARPQGPAAPASQTEPNGQPGSRAAGVVAPAAKANGNAKRGFWFRSR